MAYLAPYWLLDPLTIMIREMHVVVVYQLALLRRSSMGTAGATITCSSILASIDAETTLSIVDFPELASYHVHHKSFMVLSNPIQSKPGMTATMRFQLMSSLLTSKARSGSDDISHSLPSFTITTTSSSCLSWFDFRSVPWYDLLYFFTTSVSVWIYTGCFSTVPSLKIASTGR